MSALVPRDWQRRGRACAAALLAAVVSGAGREAAPAEAPRCPPEPSAHGAVVRVIDAETLALDDGSEVRLIGALAPRAPEPADTGAVWPPERAAREALERLVLGHPVALAVAGRTNDRYGRRLAHVFTGKGDARTWVQGALLEQGLARAYGRPGSTACLAEMLAREKEARAVGRGLWASGAYPIREAGRTRDLLARLNAFEIVEGVVRKAARVRERIYLNFGDDWRRDFTASLIVTGLSEEAVSRLTALEGREVRVRGWIERRNGPFVELSTPDEIELVEEAMPATTP